MDGCFQTSLECKLSQLELCEIFSGKCPSYQGKSRSKKALSRQMSEGKHINPAIVWLEQCNSIIRGILGMI